jgi:hypothetical protein
MALSKSSIDDLRAALKDADDEDFEAILNSYALSAVTGILLGLMPTEILAGVRDAIEKMLAERFAEENKPS